MAKPLNNLLFKKTPFVWSEECHSCYKQLKEALSKSPILQHPDPAKPYMLFCDASNYTFTGILTQAQNNPKDLRPITHTSALLSPMLVCN